LAVARSPPDLPADVQMAIIRKAGRQARRVSRLLRDTHGPLSGGLRLASFQPDLLAQDPHRFHHITALAFTDQGRHYEELLDYAPAHATHDLPQAFPNLRSLQFARDSALTGDALAPLASLSSSLTALHLPWLHGGETLLPALRSLQPLTALRSLSFFAAVAQHQGEVQEAVEAISRLPHLQQLQWLGGIPGLVDIEQEAIAAAPWFLCLRNLDLTDLGMNVGLGGWDADSIETLRTALPRLRGLTLVLNTAREPGLHNEAVMAALAQRTALTSLTLRLMNLCDWPSDHAMAPGLTSPLSALRLAELRVLPSYTRSLEATLAAMAVQRTLTSLAIDAAVDTAGGVQTAMASLTADALRSLSTLAGSLAVLELTIHHLSDGHNVFEVLGGLSLQTMCCVGSVTDTDLWHVVALKGSLTRLSLGVECGLTGPRLGAIVGQLTRLEWLELKDMEVLSDAFLHEYLLPLPRPLHTLRMSGPVHPSLQAAADRQDCVVIGVRVTRAPGCWR
jgi:hypothetical protein